MLKLFLRGLILIWGLAIALLAIGRITPPAPAIIYVLSSDTESDFYAYDLRSHLRINLSNSPYPVWRGTWSENGLFAYTANAALREADGLYISRNYAPAERFSSLRGSLIFATQVDSAGNYLLYVGSEPANFSEIFLLDLYTEERINLSNSPSINEAAPQWFGTDAVLFLRDGKLYQSDLQGNFNLLLDTPLRIENYAASPDLQTIAFHSFGNQLHFASNNTIRGLSLPYPLSSDALTWSPDSEAIAFSLTDGSLGIYRLASEELNLYASTNNRSQPLWSPDGAYIAFMEARRIHILAWQSGDIFVLDEARRIRPPLLWMP